MAPPATRAFREVPAGSPGRGLEGTKPRKRVCSRDGLLIPAGRSESRHHEFPSQSTTNDPLPKRRTASVLSRGLHFREGFSPGADHPVPSVPSNRCRDYGTAPRWVLWHFAQIAKKNERPWNIQAISSGSRPRTSCTICERRGKSRICSASRSCRNTPARASTFISRVTASRCVLTRLAISA